METYLSTYEDLPVPGAVTPGGARERKPRRGGTLGGVYCTEHSVKYALPFQPSLLPFSTSIFIRDSQPICGCIHH